MYRDVLVDHLEHIDLAFEHGLDDCACNIADDFQLREPVAVVGESDRELHLLPLLGPHGARRDLVAGLVLVDISGDLAAHIADIDRSGLLRLGSVVVGLLCNDLHIHCVRAGLFVIERCDGCLHGLQIRV